MASGFLELQGFSAAMAALDAMCKSANVTVRAVDANNAPDPGRAVVPLVVQIKLGGSVGDVSQALEVGRRSALRTMPEEFVLTHSIAAEDPGLAAVLKSGKLPPRRRSGKKKPAALGLVDVQSFSAALVVADAMLTGADVELVDMKKYLGGTMVTVAVGGTVGAVQEAVALARTRLGGGQVKNDAVITNPHGELFRFVG